MAAKQSGAGGPLTAEILAGFDKYKYSAIDTSIVSNYITHPFWNWVVQFVPRWLAPNCLTLGGFLHLIVLLGLLTFYDVAYYAANPDHPEHPNVPNWVWLACSYCVFMAHTLDGIDGKHARNTGTSSPLGEMFDHGLDSWAAGLFPMALYSVFGRAEYGVNVFRVYCIVIGVLFCFILSHWEKYNTGVLFLPWGYDLSQILITFLFFITYFGGHRMWQFRIPYTDMLVSEGFELSMHLGIFGLTLPPTLWNIYVSYRDKTGKMRSPWEALRPLVASVVLFAMFLVWVRFSQYQILENHPRLVYWTTSVVFSNITCRLIIAQMSNTRCDLLNWLLIPLAVIVAVSILFRPGEMEVHMLRMYSILATVAHIDFGYTVVNGLCNHFKIKAFSIPKK